MLDKSTAIISSPVLICTVTIENLTAVGTIRRTTTHKNAKLTVGRNEFRDILIQIQTAKWNQRFLMKDFVMHKRFVKEGKATLNLKEQLINIMISNAPPNSLLCLLKLLSGKKLKSEQDKENVPARKRLLSDRPKSFEEISPLTLKEFESLRQRSGCLPLHVRNPNSALVGASPISSKRKFASIQKSSIEEKPCKVPRSLNPMVLNMDQKKVLSSVQAGYNIFFTGSAGTGKSFLLRRLVGALPPDATFVTASTGIAACHIGGTTLHSFAGIGSGVAPLEECINLAKRPAYAQQWKLCKHLIIDEISMVDGVYFMKMEAVARFIKGNDKPFGGIQLILSGDFFQLPPVVKKGEKRVFCFQSSAWQKCITTNIELSEVKRQNDPLFIQILQNLRMGRCSLEHEKILKDTMKNVVERDGIKATRLCTHKDAVDHINNVHLEKLSGESKIYQSVDSDPYLAESFDASLPVLSKLVLKVGAQVMLMKNFDISKGLVNGARGVVTSFKGSAGLPIVKFACGVTKEMQHEKWTMKSRGGMLLTRRQIPLKLAWAFSIHKSQGMTLDCVEMSLSKVFEAGQAYVALSRARNLQSLRIIDFETACIQADPLVKKFYAYLREN